MSVSPNIPPNPYGVPPAPGVPLQANVIGIIGFCAALAAVLCAIVGATEPMLSAETPLVIGVVVAVAAIVCSAVGVRNSGGRPVPAAIPARPADAYSAAVQPPPPVVRTGARYGQRALSVWGIVIGIVSLILLVVELVYVEVSLADLHSCLTSLSTC
jgi:hypothetical protein